MRNILNSEMYKLRKGTYFWICTSLPLVIISLTYLILRLVSNTMPDIAALTPQSSVDILEFIFPECFISFIVSFMACLLVGNELRTKGINNMVQASGRERVYGAKLFAGLVISFAVALIVLVTSLFIGALFIGSIENTSHGWPYFLSFLLMQTLINFASCSIAIMLTFITKNIIVAIPVCVLFEFVVAGILSGLGYLNESLANLYSYVPIEMAKQYAVPEHFTIQSVSFSVITCVIIIASSTVAGLSCFKRTDL